MSIPVPRDQLHAMHVQENEANARDSARARRGASSRRCSRSCNWQKNRGSRQCVFLPDTSVEGVAQNVRTLRRVAEPQLTHVDAKGAARMVDVSGKDVTIRRAVAAGTVTTTTAVIELLQRDSLPKGDAVATARIAGIMGAKRTPDLIPLCHPISLHGVSVDITLRDRAVDIEATVRTADRTGVEMEALTCVAVAGLTLVDMVKAVDKGATITDVRVESKTGGRSGTWTRDGGTA